ncbi:hypothetical protein SESBI_15867 [Sesbania bispinosa]|nr:hypothetical protein SESBI_15867 [Sesbania bispinosa]
MTSNNALVLAEKKARREAKMATTTAVTKKVQIPTREGSSQVRPEKRPGVKDPFVQNIVVQPVRTAPTFTSPESSTDTRKVSPISWATPDSKEDVALNTIDEVAALSAIKKNFEADSLKLKADEEKMVEALGKVKTLTNENTQLVENNTKMADEVIQLKKALAEKQSEAILDKENCAKKVEWYEAEIERVGDLWEESAECFFHNAIDHIKFLNLGVELMTKGVNTLCVGKWYRGTGKYFVEEIPGDEEICPPPIKPIPLKEDVEREEKEGPTDADVVDLGLDAAKP